MSAAAGMAAHIVCSWLQGRPPAPSSNPSQFRQHTLLQSSNTMTWQIRTSAGPPNSASCSLMYDTCLMHLDAAGPVRPTGLTDIMLTSVCCHCNCGIMLERLHECQVLTSTGWHCAAHVWLPQGNRCPQAAGQAKGAATLQCWKELAWPP